MTKLILLLGLLCSFALKAEVRVEEDYRLGKNRVLISAIELDKEVFITVELNQKLFLTVLRFSPEGEFSLFLDGYDAQLTEKDKRILKKAVRRFRADKRMSREARLITKGALQFLLFAPEDYKHKRHETRTTDNFKGRCIYDGDTHTVYFTDFKKNVLSSTKTINMEKSEVGVCGSSFITTGWTMDCLIHDECQNTMRRLKRFELPGGLGPNCLDEFILAIDDFFFSRWFWGCTGKR